MRKNQMTAGSHIRREGDGNRLMKANQKIYWYGAGTEILDESTASGTFTNEYVFFGGKRIAIRNVSAGTSDYYEEDMLGSSRTLVQAGGTSPCFDADFLPFGYEKDVTTTCSQNYKFEGKERDTETGDDDFGARYYTFRLGRWLSADWSSVPAPVPYANLTNPQTLNLYAMISDNPESFADLTGHCGTGAPSEPCHDERGHGNSSVEGEPGSSGIVNASCSLESCETAAEASAQQTQIAAQEAANKQTKQEAPNPLVVTMTPMPDKPVILTEGAYQNVLYEVSAIDSNGTPTPVENAQDHSLELKETIPHEKRNKKKDFKTCTGQCTGSGSFTDHMEVPAGKGHSVVKRFDIDGHPARIYDQKSKTTYDFAYVDASAKTGFTFTFGNDPHPK
jgi:RHS repeat-associated protein